MKMPLADIVNDPLSGKRFERLSVFVAIPEGAEAMTAEQLEIPIRHALLDFVPGAARSLVEFLKEPIYPPGPKDCRTCRYRESAPTEVPCCNCFNNPDACKWEPIKCTKE